MGLYASEWECKLREYLTGNVAFSGKCDGPW